MKNVQETLDQLCINTIRTLAMDGVQKANSGHPGLPMGAAAMAYTLWTRALSHNPTDPSWPNRDRFILSPGHGCMLLYCLLHLTGYDLSLDELKQFRQWGSRTPGHSEHGMTPGVETTTGPLGQGFGNGVGMAIAERFLAHHFNRSGYPIVDHYTYAIVSDGDLMEGITSEAASLAGHLGLGKLIYLYDDNRITIDGSTDMAFTENVGQRFEAYGWHVQRVDGNDVKGIEAAISAAQAESDRPSLIMARTHIAYGSPNKQDTSEAHGSPLGDEEIRLTKEALGWPLEPTFYIPDEALAHFREALQRGRTREAEWQTKFDAYAAAYPELANEWNRVMSGQLPEGWAEKIPIFTPAGGGLATREASGKVLNAIASSLPTLIGGSADLTPSNNTYLKGGGDFQRSSPGGRNFHFGVREHAMGSILNGMALHQGVIPYGGTFLVFSDYVRPAIRVAALSHIHVIYVFTHDSIGLGEDGPTHQPIEHLSSLRAIPNLTVIRPADATETAVAWRAALEHRSGPVVLALTRQKLPTLDRTKFPPAELLLKGAYILADADQGHPRVILIATGSEVSLALEAWGRLVDQGIPARVVSMPSWELFDRQPEAYRDEVLPPAVTARLAIETGSPHGWHRYVGLRGGVIGMTRFGASAPYQVLLQQFGFTTEHVVSRAMELLA
ncbi:Transketolase (TK) [Candidatus Methylomirabilis oxygeniifera]|uniref:Transketolase n=1 Tax=Methylomirabilis oxygeniifera TaxID=671143 RepID=D5MKA2_METO1|nr:Transketolase (TK) [Candidatus Methylomirabilis oxyfera]